jgi:hypothetical protein
MAKKRSSEVDATEFEPFTAEDFKVYGPRYARDEQWNGRRLVVRQRMLGLGKRMAAVFAETKPASAADAPAELHIATSIHHPHLFNQNSVKRQRTYGSRPAAEKKDLKDLFGADLGKAVDPAYANMMVSVTIDETGVEWGIQVPAEAWWDGQNLKNRATSANLRSILASIPAVDAATVGGGDTGLVARIADWKGTLVPSKASETAWRDHFKVYTPGDHWWSLTRRLSVNNAVALGAAQGDAILSDLLALRPLYRFVLWRPDNNHLNLNA